jgi:hypothetical protein
MVHSHDVSRLSDKNIEHGKRVLVFYATHGGVTNCWLNHGSTAGDPNVNENISKNAARDGNAENKVAPSTASEPPLRRVF